MMLENSPSPASGPRWPSTTDCFAATYAQARSKFLRAAGDLTVQSHVHPSKGFEGEELAMDVARLGAITAKRLLLVSSGCHGVEGFCGSGIQVALMQDATLRQRARQADVAVVFIHALNPWGFSHWRRVTEEGVDLNRNFQDFLKPLPHNASYDLLAHALVPPQWPPTADDERVLAEYGAARGMRQLQAAITAGQYHHPTGLFYGGTFPTWSHRTLRSVLRVQTFNCSRLGWIDLHTGLGPRGHGERIHCGREEGRVIGRARAWWGGAVTSMGDGSSSSTPLNGLMWQAAVQECPLTEYTGIALEFGTESLEVTLNALRADHWSAQHTDADPALRAEIRDHMRNVFFIDDEAWKDAVMQQGREAVMQGISGLANSPV
jgi:hypothetical protein